MIKIDLITGFLGSGKTTFLKKYAAWLVSRGEKIGILENDLGPVNVDMMLLKSLEGENCELEMISGGCDRETHRRRFRTKLIAMGMSGYDRVLVEPSGIYDTDEFFDALHEEPLDRWYEPGSMIAVVDAKLEPDLSEAADYILASEAACAGCILISRTQEALEGETAETIAHLNRALEKVQCGRRLRAGEEILCRNWDDFTDADFERIASCGFVPADYVKRGLRDKEPFDSLFFMNSSVTEEGLRTAAARIFGDPGCGRVFRIKGFFKKEGMDGREAWSELNATRHETVISPIEEGQEILIAIGEELNKEKIERYLQGGTEG